MLNEIIVLDDKNPEFEEISKTSAYVLGIMTETLYRNAKSGLERKYFMPKREPMTEEESRAAYERSIKTSLEYLGLEINGDIEWEQAT